MKLEDITLTNFRQYYATQGLTFAQREEENITVIHGQNGAGKTSLFLAINWCLYGTDELQLSNVTDLVSKEAVSQAQIGGDPIQCSVQLNFTHEDEKYSVSRSFECVKQINGIIPTTQEKFLMLRIRQDSAKTDIIDNPIGRMNVILPSNARTYFLFDGEKIDTFAKPESRGDVQNAIYNVLKLEILKRGQRHLDDVASDYRREIRRLPNGSSSSLRDQETTLHNEKQQKHERLEDIERELKAAQKQIDSISRTLITMPNARALQQERIHVESELKQQQEHKDELINEMREIAMESVMRVALPAISKAKLLLNEKRNKGEIPSNIRQQLIQDLLDQEECICGRHFEKGSPEYHKLLSLRNNTLPGSFENEAIDLTTSLRTLEDRCLPQKNLLENTYQKYVSARTRIKSLQGQLSDLSFKLKDAPEEDISSLEDRHQGYQRDIVKLKVEQAQIVSRLETIDKDLDNLTQQISEAEIKEEREKVLQENAKIAQKASKAISDVYQYFAETMRRRIEEKANEIFKFLISKSNHFQRVKLSDDYQLEIFDRYGSPSELSAGERQVLSLSFITAMARISEEEAPLVMDTPFGRLDEAHRESITEHLPGLSDQLVLFVTDTELVGKAHENLRPHIGAEYFLSFNDATGCTQIEKGGKKR